MALDLLKWNKATGEWEIPDIEVDKIDPAYLELKTVNGSSLTGSGNVLISGSTSISQTTINFGTSPINEKTFVITDAACTGTSKIMLFAAGVSQTNENYGVPLNLSYIPAVGSFQLTADGGRELLRGQFIINYLIS